MVIIHWKTPSGYQSHGDPVTAEKAEAWIAMLSAVYKDWQHWTEPVPDDAQTTVNQPQTWDAADAAGDEG